MQDYGTRLKQWVVNKRGKQVLSSFLKYVILIITDALQDSPMKINDIELSIFLDDITFQSTDAIVNAANPSLMGGSGVDGAIQRAGGPAIIEECKKIVSKQGRLPIGQAVITTGGNLKAKYVIHTVGPVWHGGDKNEPSLLASSYRESLILAEENNLSSISFPSISTGAYGYPVYKAAKVAMKTVTSFLREEASSIKKVLFVLNDYKTFDVYQVALSEQRSSRKAKD
jgi:O-acetyl-ADP-ribose deacetylase (regulator of RNase III)